MSSTVEKALSLLELLARGGEPRGVAELARELDTPKSNVFRLLSTLASSGFLRHRPDGRYEPSFRLWELGMLAFSQKRLVEVAEPFLLQLVDRTGESAHLAVIDEGESVFIDKKDGKQPIRGFTEIGSRAPAYCCATGKAALAYQTDAQVTRVATHLTRFTDMTIVTPNALRQELSEVRRDGYAVNRGEWYDDVWGVAAPVLATGDTLYATVGIWAPRHRVEDKVDQLGAIVRATAAELSAALGCTPTQLTKAR